MIRGDGPRHFSPEYQNLHEGGCYAKAYVIVSADCSSIPVRGKHDFGWMCNPWSFPGNNNGGHGNRVVRWEEFLLQSICG